MPFNLIYKKLQEKNISQLKNKYVELTDKNVGQEDKFRNSGEILVELASYVLDIEWNNLDFGERPVNNERQSFEERVVSLF